MMRCSRISVVRLVKRGYFFFLLGMKMEGGGFGRLGGGGLGLSIDLS